MSDKKSKVEIVNKVIRPYVYYLLKVVKSYELYANLVNGSHEDEDAPFQWKLANWSNQLGNIVLELVRLGRYF